MFVIKQELKLTPGELDVCRLGRLQVPEARKNMLQLGCKEPTFPSRRQILIGAGAIAGTAISMPIFPTVAFAQDNIIQWIRAAFEGALNILEDVLQIAQKILASIIVVNDAAHEISGIVAGSITDANGPIRTELQEIGIAPESRVLLETQNVEAPSIPGDYSFLMQTALDRAEAPFRVTPV